MFSTAQVEKFKKKFNAFVLDCTCSGFEEESDFTLENDFIYKNDEKWLKRFIKFLLELQLKWVFVPAREDQKSENPDDYIASEEIKKQISSLHLCKDDKADGDESYEYDEGDNSCISLCMPCDAGNLDKMHNEKGFGIRRKSYYNLSRRANREDRNDSCKINHYAPPVRRCYKKSK